MSAKSIIIILLSVGVVLYFSSFSPRVITRGLNADDLPLYELQITNATHRKVAGVVSFKDEACRSSRFVLRENGSSELIKEHVCIPNEIEIDTYNGKPLQKEKWIRIKLDNKSGLTHVIIREAENGQGRPTIEIV